MDKTSMVATQVKELIPVIFLLTIIGLCVTIVVSEMNDEVEYKPGLYTEVSK